MTNEAGPEQDVRPDPVDTGVVQRGLAALGWCRPTSVVAKLAGGSSGSQVFLLDASGERVVLKVTEDASWQKHADRELRVYRELGSSLQEFLPAVRAWQQDRHGVRLLLTAYEPLPLGMTLPNDTWVAVAHQLGRLHSVPTPRTPWLRRREPSSNQVTEALRMWTERCSTPLVARAAAQLAAPRDAGARLSQALTHGDCHLHNLLIGPEGRALWADWQEVCLSTGLEDLVFLWQRAEFEGAHPPREEMTDAYAEARSLSADAAFRAELAACELQLLLVAWPSFLPYGSPQNQETMTQRLEQLVGHDARS